MIFRFFILRRDHTVKTNSDNNSIINLFEINIKTRERERKKTSTSIG